MVTEEKNNRFRPEIGPKLKEILEKQRQNVKRVTYGNVTPSYAEAGEILADKILEKKLV